MTELFARVPLWLSLDGGVRTLPAAARTALYELAVNGGSARCGGDPAAVLDGLCPGAGDCLKTMLDRGVIAFDGARLVLMAPDGSPSSVGSARAPAPSSPPPPLRRTDDRAAVQRLGALWSKAALDTLDARVAWLDSAAGGRFLEREGRDRAWVLDLAARNSGVNRGRFGRRVDTASVSTTASTEPSTTASTVDRVDRNHGVNHGVNPSLPPVPPLPEKNEEGASEKTRARGVNQLTATDVNHGVNLAASTSPSALLPTAERPGGSVGATEVLFELRGAGLRLSASAAQAAELNRALASVTPAWTLDGVRLLARHVRDGHLRDGWRPTLDHLRGRDASWARLLALHDEAHECSRCGGGRPDDSDPWVAAAANAGVRL